MSGMRVVVGRRSWETEAPVFQAAPCGIKVSVDQAGPLRVVDGDAATVELDREAVAALVQASAETGDPKLLNALMQPLMPFLAVALQNAAIISEALGFV